MMINGGASFGIKFLGLELISGFILIILVIIWWKDKKIWGILLMIMGGGLNLMERVRYGGVVDYWQIPFTNIYNNINDYLIVIGVIQLIWYIYGRKGKNSI